MACATMAALILIGGCGGNSPPPGGSQPATQTPQPTPEPTPEPTSEPTSGSTYEGLSGTWKLTAADPAARTYFGASVALHGDAALVGAYGDAHAGSQSGAAYIFDRHQGGTNAWGQAKKITPADATASQKFGAAVSLSGDVALIGAHGDATGAPDAGAAYVFYRNRGGTGSWGQVKKLMAADAGYRQMFGYSVSISGDVALVSAHGDAHAGIFSGSAYLFHRTQGGTDNWGQVKKLMAPTAENNDAFGMSVAVSGNIAVVGVPGDEDAGRDSGSAYVFARNRGGTDNWGQVAKLTAADGNSGHFFGVAVSVSDDVVVVGASHAGAGAAYVFQRDLGGLDNWGQVRKLTATDAAGGFFGQNVSVWGDVALVGKYDDSEAGGQAGAAYLFRRNQGGTDNWGQVARLTATEPMASQRFGGAVSTYGEAAFCGADGDNGEAGSAFLFFGVP